MRAPNLHFPDLRAALAGRLHFPAPKGMGEMHMKSPRALGNIWTLLLAVIIVAAVLTGLWMAGFGA